MTASVLNSCPGASQWRLAGVARPIAADGIWAFPAIDFNTYRALGKGRSASRTLPEGARERARVVVSHLLESPGAGAMSSGDGDPCRIVGPAADGGIRIDGGPGGFAERTVSLTDMAWVLVARDDVARNGGILDEQRVNRARYIDGTPKGSTRWIDTGWALRLVRAVSL